MNGARLSVLIFLLFLLPQAAQAAPFGFRYSGAVTSITEYTPGILGSSVQVGDAVSGRVFFNAVSADARVRLQGPGIIVEGYPSYSIYSPDWRSFRFEANVGDFHLNGTEGDVWRVDDRQFDPSGPSLKIRKELSVNTQFGDVIGFPADATSTNLPIAPGGLFISGAGVELVGEGSPPLYELFDINNLEVDLNAVDAAMGTFQSIGSQNGGETTGYRIEFAIDLDSIKAVSDVAEPSTMALLIAGLAGLGFAARRRRKAA